LNQDAEIAIHKIAAETNPAQISTRVRRSFRVVRLEWDVDAIPPKIRSRKFPPVFDNGFLLQSVSRIDPRCSMNKFQRVTRVGAKGQLVIPSELREALKLETGDAVTLQLEGGKLVIEARKTVILGIVGKYAAIITSPPIPKKLEGEQHGA
jgi:AbrB family looped-hinge helix DNA binding protein